MVTALQKYLGVAVCTKIVIYHEHLSIQQCGPGG